MKLLLDENLPHRLRKRLSGHEVFTVAYMGWQTFENGALLAVAASAGFDALLTMDSGIEYQHNPKSLPMSVVVLHAASNDLSLLVPLLPRLEIALASLERGVVVHVR